MACRVLETLPHTPVTGVGINFRFEELEPDATLLALFDFADTGRLADAGAQCRRFQINRQLDFNDALLNLQIVHVVGQAVQFDLNYHNDATNPSEASGFIANSVLSFKDNARHYRPVR